MEIKKKYMSKNNWKRVIKKKYVCDELKEEEIEGIVSLLFIEEIKSPLYEKYNNCTIKIADKNYYWLQFGIKDKNYWITAMYNDKKQVIQYYIDITDKNVINKNSDSYFYDLFLDVVLLPTGEIILLDEDELKESLQEGIISQEQYNLAYREVENIIRFISNEKDNLQQFCNKYFNILLKKIKDE